MTEISPGPDTDLASTDAASLRTERNEPASPGGLPANNQPAPTVARDSIAQPAPAEVYTLQQRRLHGIVAALVVAQLTVGVWIGITPNLPENDLLLDQLYPLHVLTGALIFVLMLMRLTLRRRLGVPPPPAGTPDDAALLAHLNHQGFYVLLLALPVFGLLTLITSGRTSTLFGGIHGGLAVTLVVAVCAHIGGVIYHNNVRRDDLLQRMSVYSGATGVRRSHS
jgi:cytochrome b561